MQCPMCRERTAEAGYYRLNRLTEEVEHLCQPCWLTLRKASADEWTYYRGAARMILLYTVIPVLVTALVVWLVALWVL